jgi:hypothetical protein
LNHGLSADGAVVGLVPVHAGHHVLTKGVVEHHVDDDGHAVLVGHVDEFLQLVLVAVVLVGGEEEGGVVAPAFVAFEFVDGHQLNGVDAQFLEVPMESMTDW